MSRVEKFSRQNKRHKKMTEVPVTTNEVNMRDKLPSRSKKHPSSKTKLVKFYYNIVFVLFVALVMFLLWYGNKYYSTIS